MSTSSAALSAPRANGAAPADLDPPHGAAPGGGAAAIGRIVSVNGGQAVIQLSPDALSGDRADRPQIGAILSIDAGPNVVFGLVSAMNAPAVDDAEEAAFGQLAEVELIGEFSKPTARRPARFRRAVTLHPMLGDPAHVASHAELAALFAGNSSASVRIGTVKQDASIPAVVSVNDLFSRHCAVLGATGSGKSSAVTLMLTAVLKRYPHGHIVILDPHNEYSGCFGDKSVAFDTTNLTLPFWMLNFEEMINLLYPGRRNCEEDVEVLAELIPTARRMNLSNTDGGAQLISDPRSDGLSITADTPVPYRVSELLSLIDRALGNLDNSRIAPVYRRVRARVKQVSTDARFSFMFGSLTVQDCMAEFLGQLFRIPVDGAPVTVVELGGLPPEVAQVIVSAIARLSFEFGLWGDGATPVVLVVEDAHLYAPVRDATPYPPARRALLRIAKEGRKTGVSLMAVSQRPTELDPMLLSECNTIFAMRLANRTDQEALKAAIPDASTSLLSCLPSLGMGEAIAIGEGVPLPARIRFDPLDRAVAPSDPAASYTDAWSVAESDEGHVDRAVMNWRANRKLTGDF